MISKWAYNWKMLFNPDPIKPAQEVIFSKKRKFKLIKKFIDNKVLLFDGRDVDDILVAIRWEHLRLV